MQRAAWTGAAVLLTLATGCPPSPTTDAGRDARADATHDAIAMDAVPDGVAPDAVPDAMVDVSTDAGPRVPASLACLDAGEYAGLTAVFRWQGAHDHFWTTSLRGEGAAAAGYRPEGAVFNVSVAASRRFTRAIHRLLGPAGHLYTTDEATRADRIAHGYSDEGVLGYIAPDAIDGCTLTPLQAYVRASDGLAFYTVNGLEGASLASQGFASQGLAGYVPPAAPRLAHGPYTVGIYYFGMWSPAAFQSINGWPFANPTFYGTDRATDWWMGVRDMHDHNCSPADASLRSRCASDPSGPDCALFSFCTMDWSMRQPAIGWYDESHVDTVERHIRQAHENGIDFFNFYFYWNHYTDRADVNDGLTSFLAARNRGDMHFALSICEHSGHLGIEPSQADGVAHAIATQYVNRPNYLRTEAGQPVIWLCDATGIGSYASGPPPAGSFDGAALDVFLNALRAQVHGTTGQYPVLATIDDRAIAHVEARSCLLPTGPAASYASIADHVGAYLDAARTPGKGLLPCFMENIDDRPRVGVMKHDGFIHVTDQSPEAFRRGLDNVKIWMDSQTDPLSRILSIYAWNEWHEGGIIEPDARDGALYLNLVNDVFQLPMGDDPCRTTGLCTAE